MQAAASSDASKTAGSTDLVEGSEGTTRSGDVAAARASATMALPCLGTAAEGDGYVHLGEASDVVVCSKNSARSRISAANFT